MMKKAKKIGDTCNTTISQYNDIRCQMQALSRFNHLEENNDSTKRIEMDILRIVDKEKDIKCFHVPELR